MGKKIQGYHQAIMLHLCRTYSTANLYSFPVPPFAASCAASFLALACCFWASSHASQVVRNDADLGYTRRLRLSTLPSQLSELDGNVRVYEGPAPSAERRHHGQNDQRLGVLYRTPAGNDKVVPMLTVPVEAHRAQASQSPSGVPFRL
ncbi:hypothetical protein P692DRAFT_201802376 [Suillus brevipes Sb2]|nr:hypothetical protein P692DRAFT_201802376 [Suillus brevipes Sb2]